MQAAKEPKVTEKMTENFQKYHIVLRSSDTTVTHQLTRKETSCSPVIFTLCELVIKAQYDSAELTPPSEIRDMYLVHNMSLARVNGIELVSAEHVRSPETANEDYWWAVRQIQNAGLYYDLLD